MRTHVGVLFGAFSLFVASNFVVSHAQAQTIGYAQAIDRLAVACGADIQKHCKGKRLGSGEIRNCLIQKQASLSNRCRTAYADAFTQLERRFAAQAAVAKICERDALQYCNGVQFGDGNYLDCMLQASRVISKRCNQAITDAGWR